eukprot:10889807-Prorocentrum_lima.AAC.1
MGPWSAASSPQPSTNEPGDTRASCAEPANIKGTRSGGDHPRTPGLDIHPLRTDRPDQTSRRGR